MTADKKCSRGQWKDYEDDCLKAQVARYGEHHWVQISQGVGTRSPKQCRERWHQNVRDGLNTGPMTKEEGAIIERLVKEIGTKWADIARFLNKNKAPGAKDRSDNAVKNYWNGINNKTKRDDARKQLKANRQDPRIRYSTHRAVTQQLQQPFNPRYDTSNGTAYPQSSFNMDHSASFVSQAPSQRSSYSYQGPAQSSVYSQDFLRTRYNNMDIVMPPPITYQHQSRDTSFDSMPPQDNALTVPMEGWRYAPTHSIPQHSYPQSTMPPSAMSQSSMAPNTLSQSSMPQHTISQFSMPQYPTHYGYAPIVPANISHYYSQGGYALPMLKSNVPEDESESKPNFHFRDPWRNEMYAAIGAQLPTPQSSVVPSPATIASATERPDPMPHSPERDNRMTLNNLLHRTNDAP